MSTVRHYGRQRDPMLDRPGARECLPMLPDNYCGRLAIPVYQCNWLVYLKWTYVSDSCSGWSYHVVGRKIRACVNLLLPQYASNLCGSEGYEWTMPHAAGLREEGNLPHWVQPGWAERCTCPAIWESQCPQQRPSHSALDTASPPPQGGCGSGLGW